MNFFKELKSDLSASIVVFFAALPLCLGIALASCFAFFRHCGRHGKRYVVGYARDPQLGEGVPAAGLAVIVFGAIATLGCWEIFCRRKKPLVR